MLAACGGVALVAFLLWSLAGVPNREKSFATSTIVAGKFAPQATTSPQGSTSNQIAAEVNDEIITLDEWHKTTALEQALNTLAGKPSSPAEAVLDRLINEKIALLASRGTPTPEAAGTAGADARLQALMQTWGANETDLNDAVTQAGITRQELVNEIGKLLIVENILQQAGGEDGGQSWLKARREQARVSIFTNLNEPAGTTTAAISSTQASNVSPTEIDSQNQATPLPAIISTSTVQQNNPTENIENISTGPNEGQLAPDITLPLTSGDNLTLSKLRGHPVVLNFWATWCPVCRKELPAMQAAARQWIPQGVALVSIDLREDAATVTEFAASNNLTYTLALDTDGAVSQLYQVLGIPTTLFIDANGVVRSRVIGPLTEEAFAERIEPLLPSQAAIETAPTAKPTNSSSSGEISVYPNSPYDFTLEDQFGQPFTLSAALGKQKLVLVFYRGKT